MITHQNNGREDEDHGVEREAGDHVTNEEIHDLEESTGHDSFTKRNTAHRKENNRPCKLFKVVLQGEEKKARGVSTLKPRT